LKEENSAHFLTRETVKKYRFSAGELERIRYNSGRIISGTQEEVKEQLTDLAHQFEVDEIVISTMADSAAKTASNHLN
jgi:alkanesulfonate monooxygenase SsuD/methylene tetrahydromethanopterin reductase-like flavin-dependent oxidoreductase (luciferase family)